MDRVIIWIVWLLFMLTLCFVQSRRVILTPQFGFIVGFIPQAVFLFFFIEKWKINLSNQTMYVLIGSVTLFYVIAVSYEYCYLMFHNKTRAYIETRGATIDQPIYLNKGVMVGLIIFRVIVLLVWLYYLGKYVQGGTLLNKFTRLTSIYKFGDIEDRVQFPFILNRMKTFANASGYVMCYLLAHSIIYKYNANRKLIYLNLACWVVEMLTSGNRGPFIAAIIAAAVQAYIIWGKSKGWRNRIPMKTVFYVLALAIIIILALYFTLSWFGRATEINMIDYLGIYLSAPLKNLDTFIRQGKFGCDFAQSETFAGIATSLGKIFGKKDWMHRPKMPFQYFEGYNLGNVYTCFYLYLHDGSYLLCAVLVGLMSILSQSVYSKAIYGKNSGGINIATILYSYMFQTILLSFFSDRFYLYLFSVNMIETLISFWLLRLLLTRVRFRKSRLRLIMER